MFEDIEILMVNNVNSFHARGHFCCLLITFANSLYTFMCTNNWVQKHYKSTQTFMCTIAQEHALIYSCATILEYLYSYIYVHQFLSTSTHIFMCNNPWVPLLIHLCEPVPEYKHSYIHVHWCLSTTTHTLMIKIALGPPLIHLCAQYMLVGWFCCFTSQVNSYGHWGTVSSPNHTFSWAGLNKRLTSNSCTYFRL